MQASGARRGRLVGSPQGLGIGVPGDLAIWAAGSRNPEFSELNLALSENCVFQSGRGYVIARASLRVQDSRNMDAFENSGLLIVNQFWILA